MYELVLNLIRLLQTKEKNILQKAQKLHQKRIKKAKEQDNRDIRDIEQALTTL